MMQKCTEPYGQRLKMIRELLDLTQQTLSERIGVSRPYIADIELGRKDPSWNFLVKLINKINISGDWFVTGEGEVFLAGMRRTLRDRLVEVLAQTKRGVDDWVASIGGDSKVLACLGGDHGDWDEALLVRAGHLEGFRREWLINGLGRPFSGGYYRTDLDAKERLDWVVSQERGWHLYLVTDHQHFCVVLIAPASVEQKQAPSYEYTVMEVIGGAVGRQTLAAVRDLLGRYALYVVVVEAEQLVRLVGGFMGIYEFVGRGKVSGLLSGAIKITHCLEIDSYFPEPLLQVDTTALVKACDRAGEDPQSARILSWLCSWLPRATLADRVYLEGLLKRNFAEFGGPVQGGEV